MSRSRSGLRRGQPLVALALVLAGWVGARAMLWEEIQLPGVLDRVKEAVTIAASPEESQPLEKARGGAPAPGVKAEPIRQAEPWAVTARQLPASIDPAPIAPLPGANHGAIPPPGGSAPRISGAHQIAWIAGLAQLPVPAFVQDRLGPVERSAALAPSLSGAVTGPGRAASRWSVDGWLLLRQGGAQLGAGGLPTPSYGASQAGAVVRYRLAPGSALRPVAYLRASTAARAPRGEEVAAGLALRPLVRVPIALTAELRATNLQSGLAARPAVSLVTEFDRFRLPAGLRAEVYGQAGYVGGKAGTAFVDGQARVERVVTRIGPAELRAGGGVWGGAQRGANRLDLGPTATLDFPLAGGQARVAADWRIRVAGNAAPRSGPAVTLSAGF